MASALIIQGKVPLHRNGKLGHWKIGTMGKFGLEGGADGLARRLEVETARTLWS
jgi:hypothetical protein